MRAVLVTAAKEASDPDAEARLGVLKDWGRAQGQLRAYNVKALVGKRLVEEGRWDGDLPDEGSPQTLISGFMYGELVHWGDKRDEVARWQADGFLGPWNQIRFLEATAGLAHFYMGYAVIVAGAIGPAASTP